MKSFRRFNGSVSAGAAALFLISVLALPLLAEEHVLVLSETPGNLTLAQTMCEEVARDALAQLLPAVGKAMVLLRPGKENPGNSLARLALEEALLAEGLKQTEWPESAGQILEYRILDLQIAYTGFEREALGLKKYVKRAGSLSLSLTLLDASSGEVLSRSRSGILLEDQFPRNLLDVVESEQYPFTKPLLVEKEWSKLVEPWVVGGLVASLAWLFFSNQSSE
ncbi:MAG: hypothetical protein QF492_06765 [Candidatus Krumholzibacteria bacterium]|jgi:hypothetical protein|nr:hypothetical protein [Candidatus Krumholzibacteria bacterium]MDP6796407.1 hypothetical protein [Candidatus Krumholzibacteria bacterium]MDP7020796.1 hypothetical protein [Candidatus Krumholzibacteria bacterium]